MRHLTLEELLELEQTPPSPEMLEHLASCSRCAAERSSLAERRSQLRALPELGPRTDRWPAIQHALQRERRRRQAAWGAVAMAAALACFVVISTLRRAPVVHPVQPLVQKSAEGNPELTQLIQQSQTLEKQLRQSPEPEALSMGTAATLVDLEDQLSFIDQCIAQLRQGSGSAEEISALYKNRLELLQALISGRKPPIALVSL